MMFNYCEECLNKQREIDYLKDENQRLRQKLRYKNRKDNEGFFGSSTSSAKIPVKANTPDTEIKPRGAQEGHQGFGRKKISLSEADRIETIAPSAGENCPDCGNTLTEKGFDERTVFDIRPIKAERIIYRLPKKYCRHCRRTFSRPRRECCPKAFTETN